MEKKEITISDDKDICTERKNEIAISDIQGSRLLLKVGGAKFWQKDFLPKLVFHKKYARRSSEKS